MILKLSTFYQNFTIVSLDCSKKIYISTIHDLCAFTQFFYGQREITDSDICTGYLSGYSFAEFPGKREYLLYDKTPARKNSYSCIRSIQMAARMQLFQSETGSGTFKGTGFQQ